MSIPKEPRQQMINMMYLVLTALLALNVSAEILNAFKLVTDGLHVSNNAMESKNDEIMTQFINKDKQDHAKAAKYMADANAAKKATDDFITYIDSLKNFIIIQTGGYDVDGDDSVLHGKKDYNTPTRILVDDKKGEDLEKKIVELKKTLSSLPSLDPDEQKNLAAQMTLTDHYNEKAAKNLGKKDWTEYHFDHVPTIAVITLLTKFKGDAINSYGMIEEYLFKKISQKDYSFNALSPMVNANSNYVLDGQEYNAKIFLSAFSTTQNPEYLFGPLKPGLQKDASGAYKVMDENPVIGGGTKLTDDKVVSGQGVIKEIASGSGERTKTGAIKIRKPNSDAFEYYPFELKYVAAEAAVVVSPDKMNVFFIGVDNPVSISVPGYGSDKITASMSGDGSIVKGGAGPYTVRVTKPGTTQVVVSAKGEDGKMKSFPPKEFRVKRVPDPIAEVGTFTGGKIPAAQFKVQRGVRAVLENFFFDLKFEVISYDMMYAAKRQDLQQKSATGPVFTPAMLDYLKVAKPGDSFYFDEIKVKGPDGLTRKLPSIVFQLI